MKSWKAAHDRACRTSALERASSAIFHRHGFLASSELVQSRQRVSGAAIIGRHHSRLRRVKIEHEIGGEGRKEPDHKSVLAVIGFVEGTEHEGKQDSLYRR